MSIESIVRQCWGVGAAVKDQEEMDKGASARRYFRLRLAGAPVESAVVMWLRDDPSAAVDAGDASWELPFVNVQRCLSQAGLPVPDIYCDASTDGMLLLEDLGDVTFHRVVAGATDGALERWYRIAVALLCQMHERMWPVPQHCRAARCFFDCALLRAELEHYLEWGLVARRETPLDPGLRQRLGLAFDAFARTLDALPRGFVHRDYQSRNLMVRNSEPSPGALTIIDFQDAFTGPRCYDLVALLNDSYVELNASLKNSLIDAYAQLRGLPSVDVRREFLLLTVQRKLKDGGRFVFLDRVRHDPSFLPFVETSFRRVSSALAQLDGLEELKDLLAQADPVFFG
jgi:aminoglycoside/choline kinase family phosphotransferase